MNEEQNRQEVKKRMSEYLSMITEKKGSQYICPICGSGKGKNKTPAGQLNEDYTFHCYSCGFHGDIFHLVGKIENITESSEKFKRACSIFHLFTDKNKKSNQTNAERQESPKSADYIAYYKECHARVSETDYFSFRGLSEATVNKFMLGYDPEWRSPKALRANKSPPASSRIIIPTSKYSYIARATEPNADPKYKAVKEGSAEIFNLKALNGTNPVFIVEGEIDALSVIEAGGQALALGGVSNKQKLIELFTSLQVAVPVILSLDNDDAGKNAQSELAEALKTLKFNFLEINISGEYKDPNEHLTNAPDAFKSIINEDYIKIFQAEAEAAREKYISERAVTAQIDNFLGQVKASADTPAVPTGFDELDSTLDEGLYEGLYILGAISSLGKTSFALQIADQIAQQGHDVLIFSLEMARTELMAKSISRLTYLDCGDNLNNAKTTRGITAGKRYANYSEMERQLINDSVEKYAEYTDRLFIYEGIGDIGVSQIRETAETHIKSTGNNPVIIIDYLQILTPPEPRGSDKQNTDKAVFELKRLSRDFKIPILGISSLNRENYTNKISMSAFKESGAIEYSSDVLLGMQFEAFGNSLGENGTPITSDNIDRLKRENVRKIELKILKNRNGATGDSIMYDYYPMFNYFKETGMKTNGNADNARGNGKRL